ncbi:hypothetical protein RFI_30709 [Reticulomyxa filosa]|uniref:F-box domain-containing protein n=1 Tax=Reticulomyxa filosa TaxID=46433 RepID=X6LXK7_RETFI|nr:hypothetical protein RFI_30709 [Reticulomyxa filosa]|eukprot:ETO06683.1 hypothetical protein RFI_30709 [Reticulomyxa filosa]
MLVPISSKVTLKNNKNYKTTSWIYKVVSCFNCVSTDNIAKKQKLLTEMKTILNKLAQIDQFCITKENKKKNLQKKRNIPDDLVTHTLLFLSLVERCKLASTSLTFYKCAYEANVNKNQRAQKLVCLRMEVEYIRDKDRLGNKSRVEYSANKNQLNVKIFVQSLFDHQLQIKSEHTNQLLTPSLMLKRYLSKFKEMDLQVSFKDLLDIVSYCDEQYSCLTSLQELNKNSQTPFYNIESLRLEMAPNSSLEEDF